MKKINAVIAILTALFIASCSNEPPRPADEDVAAIFNALYTSSMTCYTAAGSAPGSTDSNGTYTAVTAYNGGLSGSIDITLTEPEAVGGVLLTTIAMTFTDYSDSLSDAVFDGSVTMVRRSVKEPDPSNVYVFESAALTSDITMSGVSITTFVMDLVLGTSGMNPTKTGTIVADGSTFIFN